MYILADSRHRPVTTRRCWQSVCTQIAQGRNNVGTWLPDGRCLPVQNSQVYRYIHLFPLWVLQLTIRTIFRISASRSKLQWDRELCDCAFKGICTSILRIGLLRVLHNTSWIRSILYRWTITSIYHLPFFRVMKPHIQSWYMLIGR